MSRKNAKFFKGKAKPRFSRRVNSRPHGTQAKFIFAVRAELNVSNHSVPGLSGTLFPVLRLNSRSEVRRTAPL
jgi:hypothetical protein